MVDLGVCLLEICSLNKNNLNECFLKFMYRRLKGGGGFYGNNNQRSKGIGQWPIN